MFASRTLVMAVTPSNQKCRGTSSSRQGGTTKIKQKSGVDREDVAVAPPRPLPDAASSLSTQASRPPLNNQPMCKFLVRPGPREARVAHPGRLVSTAAVRSRHQLVSNC